MSPINKQQGRQHSFCPRPLFTFRRLRNKRRFSTSPLSDICIHSRYLALIMRSTLYLGTFVDWGDYMLNAILDNLLQLYICEHCPLQAIKINLIIRINHNHNHITETGEHILYKTSWRWKYATALKLHIDFHFSCHFFNVGIIMREWVSGSHIISCFAASNLKTRWYEYVFKFYDYYGSRGANNKPKKSQDLYM